ncbi:dihydrolipoyl dehydrogenase family protein [Desulfovibrio ferrophilus]|uniref:Pyruvate/2-oxoglutarate dehydrogenase complex, dihydrolipoamide dehydrogenase component n=1 Tax=Desulfovibrio ferrophilus TaxID=241368 RepID=A0A2Z6B2I6_9BACT|nr:FAD-dependent oxidoreductase [Desulfovibrio ferrophilus]BBD09636.1 pyruvate/2-oxoglutarate dehydrogenase complex, dihydrolipoamide dehydrogenase component [Desulfovibrio ferrophilus]
MTKYDYDIGVIGGGAAGLTIAAGSSQLGAKTLLVEKDDKLGGDCLHYGCVPSKTLIHSAHVYHQMKNASRFGLPQPEIPPVDFSKVTARIAEVIETIQVHDSVERFCGLGAQVEFGDARFADEHSITFGGKTISARTWAIATGSSPGIPPFKGLDQTPFITNKQIFSLKKLPESMIVLGAGPIATEMAQAFNRLGTRVEVVQRSTQILSKEDQDMAGVVMDAMAAEGVVFHLGASVIEVRDAHGQREVEFELGNGDRKTVRAEVLLVALGRTTNTAGLGLETIGVDMTKRGIPVDSRMRTSQKHIFAAGDVTGQHQFTHAAGYEGGIVVSNAIFRLPRKADYTHMPWCTYTWPELASIGLNEKSAQTAGREVEVMTENFEGNDRALAEGENRGKLKLLLDKGKPVGIQIAGPHAGELISEWVAIQNGGVKLSTLAGAIHPYPTLSEINKRVAGSYLGPKIFSDKIKKTLKFFFSYKGNACVLPED